MTEVLQDINLMLLPCLSGNDKDSLAQMHDCPCKLSSDVMSLQW
jgi:hypothetical protein